MTISFSDKAKGVVALVEEHDLLCGQADMVNRTIQYYAKMIQEESDKHKEIIDKMILIEDAIIKVMEV